MTSNLGHHVIRRDGVGVVAQGRLASHQASQSMPRAVMRRRLSSRARLGLQLDRGPERISAGEGGRLDASRADVGHATVCTAKEGVARVGAEMLDSLGALAACRRGPGRWCCVWARVVSAWRRLLPSGKHEEAGQKQRTAGLVSPACSVLSLACMPPNSRASSKRPGSSDMPPGQDVSDHFAQKGGRAATVTTAVPEVRLVSIEHPCIVKHFDHGFKSLGGEQQVKHILEDDSDHDGRPRKAQKRDRSSPTVGVSLRPHDPLAKKLESSPTTTHNILVKVTLPKWTGRKRRRGTNDPFTAAESDGTRFDISAPDLIRRLQDNANQYKVEAIGRSETSHRFDTLPDLHAHDRDVPIMRELREHAMTPQYDLLKKFQIDLKPGTTGITAFPRPTHFIPPDIELEDPPEIDRDPQPPQQNTTQDTPRLSYQTKFKFTPGAEVPAALKPTVEAINQLLEMRPIITRLALQHAFPDTPNFRLDTAATWATTKSREGPWKDCFVKSGIDPTTSPQYRFYQIVVSRMQHAGKNTEDSGSHVFDGQTKTKGRTFQYCNLTDPTLASIVNTPHFRSQEEGYGGAQLGWYHNGTVAKIKVLMADKLKRMHSPSSMLDERAYAAAAALPDKIEEGTVCEVDGKVWGAEARALGAMIRKEALRLIGGLKGGEGPKGGGDGGDGEEEVEGEEMAIDPALMIDEHQRAEDYGNRLAAQVSQPAASEGVESRAAANT